MLSENHPIIRRILRFIALPYCYFFLVNWKECTASRLQVLKDLLYIFFKLKYYPDNYSPCRFWEKDRKEWKKFLNRKNQSELNRTEIKLVARLYSELYNVKYSEPCTCNGRIYKSWIEQINKKYESK